MINSKGVLEKYQIKPLGYRKKKEVIIVDTKTDKYVLKKKKQDNKNLFNYLYLRNYDYFPDICGEDDDYYIYRYYDNYDIPNYERCEEIVNLVSLLHSKTTHYRDVDIDDHKVIYEEIAKKIDDLFLFYNEIFELIDMEIYMSPSSYLLARNISKINSLLYFCNNELDNWYGMVKDKKKERVSVIHNNLELDHLIRSDKSYLISWDNVKVDLPIYDLYNFYKINWKDIDFKEVLINYESRYPLVDDERKLLFLLISLPEKLEFGNDEYKNTILVNDLLSYIYSTDEVISQYYSNEKKEEEEYFKK